MMITIQNILVLSDSKNTILKSKVDVSIEYLSMMAGGLGNDTFICDQYDTIVDFNPIQGYKIIGICFLQDRFNNEASYDDFSREVVKSPFPPPLQSPPLFTNDDTSLMVL